MSRPVTPDSYTAAMADIPLPLFDDQPDEVPGGRVVSLNEYRRAAIERGPRTEGSRSGRSLTAREVTHRERMLAFLANAR